MRGQERLDGQWWWKSGVRRPGVLVLHEKGGVELLLDGSFPGFDSDPPIEGLTHTPKVIRGTTADGRRFTLVDCARVGSSVQVSGGQRRHKETRYRVSWYVLGAHFATYAEIRFTQLSFSTDYINDLVGETFVFPKHYKRNRGFRLIYRRPKDLTMRIGDFTIRAWQDIPIPFSSTFPIAEQGRITVSAPTRRSFDELWTGPVMIVRSLLAFMAERRLRLLHVSGIIGRKKFDVCELGGLGRSKAPKRLGRHANQEALFTLRDLDSATRQSMLQGWANSMTTDTLVPIWALYTAATQQKRLFKETRFLMLAQALESYHRTTSTATRVPADEHDARLARILAALNDDDRRWTKDALAFSNQPTLRTRLGGLFTDLPRSLFDQLFGRKTDRGALVERIVQTRNYLTHFNPAAQTKRLRGFKLIEATDGLRGMMQYFILRHIGVDARKAIDIVWATSVRDHSRTRTVYGMFPLGD